MINSQPMPYTTEPNANAAITSPNRRYSRQTNTQNPINAFMTHSFVCDQPTLWCGAENRTGSRFVYAYLTGLHFFVGIVSVITKSLIPRRNWTTPDITRTSSPSPIFNDYSLAFSGGLSAQIPMVSSIRIHGTPLATSKSFESQWKFAFLAVLHKFLGYCLEGELSTGLPWLARARKDICPVWSHLAADFIQPCGCRFTWSPAIRSTPDGPDSGSGLALDATLLRRHTRQTRTTVDSWRVSL